MSGQRAHATSTDPVVLFREHSTDEQDRWLAAIGRGVKRAGQWMHAFLAGMVLCIAAYGWSGPPRDSGLLFLAVGMAGAAAGFYAHGLTLVRPVRPLLTASVLTAPQQAILRGRAVWHLETKPGDERLGTYETMPDLKEKMVANMNAQQKRRGMLKDAANDGVGRHRRWGRLDVTPFPVARTVQRLRLTLTVYCPGTTWVDRLCLSARSFAPVWWAVAALVAIVAVVTAGLRLGALVAAAIVAAGWLAAFWRARKIAHASHVIRATYTPRDEFSGDLEKLSEIAARLDALDAATLEPIAYEAELWSIYDNMVPEASETDR